MVIDLVDSRKYPDRAGLQNALLDVLHTVNESVPALQPLRPSVGDESQAVYATVTDALIATLLVRLYFLHHGDCRFGIGMGEVRIVDPAEQGLIQDGSAWWNARDAIIECRRREKDRDSTLRTWFLAEHSIPDSPPPTLVNSYLLSRDHLVSRLSGRNRRLLIGLIDGAKQVELAQLENISESAVSQTLRSSGVHAILSGMRLLTSTDDS
ncbi:MAG TPA: SatD family protein [Terrimesophilobacter sp.]|nr:SatD family protein [Terrimesophilobacter sp.]